MQNSWISHSLRSSTLPYAKNPDQIMLNTFVSFCFCDALFLFSWKQGYLSKWFEPRSISSLCSVIVRVSVVLKRTVGDSDWCFDNLSGRHLQSHCDIVLSVDGIYVSGYWPDWSIKLSCYWLWDSLTVMLLAVKLVIVDWCVSIRLLFWSVYC